ATAQILGLAAVPAIADPLSAWVGELKISAIASTTAAGGPAIQTVHVVRRPPKLQRKPPAQRQRDADAFDIQWSVDAKGLVAVAGADAKATYASLSDPSKPKRLGDDPAYRALVAGLGPNLSFALVADAQILGIAPVGAGSAPIVLAYGKSEG